jgi:Ca-activated chloride channel family protein
MPRTRTQTRLHAAAIAQGPVAILQTAEGTTVPLQGVTAHGRLEGLVFELTVEQRYRNDTNRNVEAVFTIPLPVRAVLLGFELEVGARRLKAQTVARQVASERYEQALDQGDTAAVIEYLGNGLYTVSLGNLMAGESAVIRYRYAELLDAHDGSVRLNVPTVIAPRYGNPSDAGLEGPAVPGVDVLGQYPFEISLDLLRVTNVAGLRSPSHRIATTVREDGLTVRLNRSGFLDRDFVLELDQATIPPHALLAKDGDDYVVLASATLGFDAAEQRPLALKILLDCSGSMGGDSIDAAKRALLAVLDRLNPDDRIGLTRFGSSVEQVTEGLEPADPHSLAALKSVVRQIDADLGGTEMLQALQAALALDTPDDRQADLILITDGEIYDVASVVNLAAVSDHRLFAIAIGAAPNEALARSLSETTGGACEFVGPTEDAEAAILRTFKRLRANPRTLGQVQWSAQPDWIAPLPGTVFPGDTLHLLAGFKEQPRGSVVITVREAAGQGTAVHLEVANQLTGGDLLPRLAAARRISSLDEATARDLAVRYQLACPYTSFVVVAERADGEKATDLPATVAVPHMLAAGWGGSASVGEELCGSLDPGALSSASHTTSRAGSRMPGAAMRSSRPVDDEYLEIPSFLRRQVDTALTSFGPSDRTTLLQSLLAAHQRGLPLPSTLAELATDHPVTPAVIAALYQIIADMGHDEREILRVFLALLAEDAVAKGLDRDFRSTLRGSIFGSRAHRTLRSILKKEIFS